MKTNRYVNNSSQQIVEPALYSVNMEGCDSYRILVLFRYSYKYGHNWAHKYEILLESVMVTSCSIFQ
jgi:hypothetical protein